MRTKLREDEKKIYIARKHWFIFVIPTLLLLLFINGTIGGYIQYLRTGDKYSLIPFFLSIYMVFVIIIYLIYKMFDRRVNIWFVTNMRVIDEWGVLNRHAKESPLDKIHNISYEQPLFGRIFGYGNIQIQTAAEMGATTHKCISKPKLLWYAVTRGQEIFKQAKMKEQAESLAQVISHESRLKTDMRECPYCTEIIKVKAKICRFCGKEL
ncbi:MAG: PH domain-containing protein [Candidatus Methanofastidiosia archaeon]